MGDLLAPARTHVSDHSYKTSGGAHVQLCPMCPMEHQICQFQAGSLKCVRYQCRNPHHRSGA
jgi:hypothetical protein